MNSCGGRWGSFPCSWECDRFVKCELRRHVGCRPACSLFLSPGGCSRPWIGRVVSMSLSCRWSWTRTLSDALTVLHDTACRKRSGFPVTWQRTAEAIVKRTYLPPPGRIVSDRRIRSLWPPLARTWRSITSGVWNCQFCLVVTSRGIPSGKNCPYSKFQTWVNIEGFVRVGRRSKRRWFLVFEGGILSDFSLLLCSLCTNFGILM